MPAPTSKAAEVSVIPPGGSGGGSVTRSLEIISGIAGPIERADIRAAFRQFGEIEALYLPPSALRNVEPARVRFTSPAAAARAAAACDRGELRLQNAFIICQPLRRPSATPRPSAFEVPAPRSGGMAAKASSSRRRRLGKRPLHLSGARRTLGGRLSGTGVDGEVADSAPRRTRVGALLAELRSLLLEGRAGPAADVGGAAAALDELAAGFRGSETLRPGQLGTASAAAAAKGQPSSHGVARSRSRRGRGGHGGPGHGAVAREGKEASSSLSSERATPIDGPSAPSAPAPAPTATVATAPPPDRSGSGRPPPFVAATPCKEERWYGVMRREGRDANCCQISSEAVIKQYGHDALLRFRDNPGMEALTPGTPVSFAVIVDRHGQPLVVDVRVEAKRPVVDEIDDDEEEVEAADEEKQEPAKARLHKEKVLGVKAEEEAPRPPPQHPPLHRPDTQGSSYSSCSSSLTTSAPMAAKSTALLLVRNLSENPGGQSGAPLERCLEEIFNPSLTMLPAYDKSLGPPVQTVRQHSPGVVVMTMQSSAIVPGAARILDKLDLFGTRIEVRALRPGEGVPSN